ncbi:MAG: polyketide cyclase [Actinomycetota bacterium]|nr:polyketide cyclase [Actinomycetota bacterium]
MTTDERIFSTRVIAAPASAIYALVSSPAGHVQIDGSGMLVASPESTPVTAVGDTFVMHMDREPLGDIPEMGKYDVTVIITNIAVDQLVEWGIQGNDGKPFGYVYGYALQAVDEHSTEVTSYCDWSGLSEKRKARIAFPIVPLSMMEKSLDNLEAIVTA